MRLSSVVLLGILGIAGGFISPEACAGSSVRDGFSASRVLHSQYFTIYVEEGGDLQSLAMKLAVPPSVKAIIKNPLPFSDASDFSYQLDTLFLAVSEIMEIHLKKFKGQIKICKNAESLSRVASNLFGSPIQPRAFYVVALDILYVDAESVTLNVLGHELSHAIQTHYFVVPTPEKIQEVLAGFVEYELRKYNRDTLPG